MKIPSNFTEAQFFPKRWFLARWLAAIFLFAYRHRIAGPWQAVVIFPERAADVGPHPAADALAQAGILHRVYLSDLADKPGSALGLGPASPAWSYFPRKWRSARPAPCWRPSLPGLRHSTCWI